MKRSYDESVDFLDSLLRKGQGSAARAELLKMNHLKIPQALRAEIAALACRADLPELSVRILHSIVQPPKGQPSKATDAEKAEYAIGLIKIGAVNEGLNILETLNPSAYPRLLLYRASGYIACWDYARAIPPLTEASEASRLSDYQKLVCKVNLAGALVHERRFSDADALLELLKKETGDRWPVIYGNVLKYWAELKIQMRDFRAANTLLNGAEKALTQFGGRDGFYVRKWKTLAEVIETKGSASSLHKLQAIQTEAREKKHWETVRDCDYYKAIHAHDRETLLHLYAGTPYESYRRRLTADWKEPLLLAETYTWVLEGKATKRPLGLLLGEIPEGCARLKVGQSSHRLLLALSSDFYRPMRLPAMHASVFPDEKFNPATSPAKLHNLIIRFRKWLSENKLPLTIQEESQHYRLSAIAGCSLAVPLDRDRKPDSFDFNLARLQEVFSSDFSVAEAIQTLELSHTSALRVLSKGLQEGVLGRTGKGKATRYSFSNVPKNFKSAA